MQNIGDIRPNIFVIFGGTGDLTYRKLMPAVYNMFIENLLPENFSVICIGRRDFTQEHYEKNVLEALEKFAKDTFSIEKFKIFKRRFEYLKLDFIKDITYTPLNVRISSLCKENNFKEHILYYMAVSPEFFPIIIESLSKNKLVDKKGGIKRVIIEKPFGQDLKSARDLNEKITNVFTEKETYRIDHYLGKEMIQNIMAIRFANPILESVWNHKYIDNIQITSSESLGVLTRGLYYETSGALKDMFQNHMLQLLTLIAMEPPAFLDTESIRDEKVKVLKSIRENDENFVRENIIRGQYIEDENKTLKAYRDEENVSKDSQTETFVAVKTYINNYRWTGVPFYIRTGKSLKKKVTEVVIEFKKAPFLLYDYDNSVDPNLLVIRIQPDERIFLSLNVKKQGNESEIIPIQMDFCQSCISNVSKEAYQKLIYDAIRGDSTLFTRWDETEFSWKYVENILDIWKNSDIPLYNYKSLTYGPMESDLLLSKENRKWWDI